jgi:hypothetical protein
LHVAGETLLLPPTVLAETCYWLNEHRGPDLEAAFLDSVVDGTFQTRRSDAGGFERMAELVRQFSSFPLGGTDGSVVAVSPESNRLRISMVFPFIGHLRSGSAGRDRLLHRSVVLDIAGDSYRLRSHHARTDKLRAGTRPGTLR